MSKQEPPSGTTSTAGAGIAPEQRERILAVARKLATLWNGENFINFILPSIALVYNRNHNGRTDEEPTLKDFQEGMAFTYEKGGFENVVPQLKPNTPPAQFSCPARGIIMRSASCTIDGEGAESPGAAKRGMMQDSGRALFGIYQKIAHEFSEEKWITNELTRNLYNAMHREKDENFKNI